MRFERRETLLIQGTFGSFALARMTDLIAILPASHITIIPAFAVQGHPYFLISIRLHGEA
jgi:hypothetical protein